MIGKNEKKIHGQFGIKSIVQSRAITDPWKIANYSTCSRIPLISKDNIADTCICIIICNINMFKIEYQNYIH